MSHYVPLRKRTGMSRSLLKKKKRRGSPGACRLGVLIPREESNAMNRLITSTAIPARELKIEALASMSASFERLCLAAGLEALGEMMEVDAQTACGPRHGRGKDRTAHRWGKTKGKIGFHGGKVEKSCSASAKNKSPFPHEFPPPIRLSSPGFSCSAREKSKPRNGAGEIFITAAAEIARETVSATNRFEHETGKPRKFARK